MSARALDSRPDRTQSMGGSDAGAACGIDPYCSPFKLYSKKTGALTENADTNATYWGRVLEDVVAQEYAKRRGVSVRRVNAPRTHPKYPWMTANVDRLIEGGTRLLECKTSNQYRADEWGPEGSDEVPPPYLAQTQHYLAVTGRAVADLAVLIGGQDFRIYEISRDEELIAYVIEIEAAFWSRVQRRDPPQVQSLADAKLAWPRDNGRAIIATVEIEGKVESLKSIKREGRECSHREENLELEIKAYMGEHESLLSPDARPLATWRDAKPSQHFDGARFAAAHPDLYKQYLIERPGARRFLAKVERPV